MKDIERILFPVDLSEPSERLVPYVLNTARMLNAKIYVVYILQGLEHLADMHVPMTEIQDFQRLTQENVDRKLAEFCENHLSSAVGLSFTTRIGDPAHEILKYAEEVGADLIIMGTHGRSGMDKFIFGSVADKIVKTSAIPVMTVRPLKRD